MRGGTATLGLLNITLDKIFILITKSKEPTFDNDMATFHFHYSRCSLADKTEFWSEVKEAEQASFSHELG